MVRFSKYEFYNKLLSGVTLLRVTPGVTWTQLYIYIYNHVSVAYFEKLYLDDKTPIWGKIPFNYNPKIKLIINLSSFHQIEGLYF